MGPREPLLAPHIMSGKGKPKRMSQDTTSETQRAKRRDTEQRRNDDRRAHDRFTPEKATRIDRRQGERRRERNDS
jgi:hypothetical protein